MQAGSCQGIDHRARALEGANDTRGAVAVPQTDACFYSCSGACSLVLLACKKVNVIDFAARFAAAMVLVVRDFWSTFDTSGYPQAASQMMACHDVTYYVAQRMETCIPSEEVCRLWKRLRTHMQDMYRQMPNPAWPTKCYHHVLTCWMETLIPIFTVHMTRQAMCDYMRPLPEKNATPTYPASTRLQSYGNMSKVTPKNELGVRMGWNFIDMPAGEGSFPKKWRNMVIGMDKTLEEQRQFGYGHMRKGWTVLPAGPVFTMFVVSEDTAKGFDLDDLRITLDGCKGNESTKSDCLHMNWSADDKDCNYDATRQYFKILRGKIMWSLLKDSVICMRVFRLCMS